MMPRRMPPRAATAPPVGYRPMCDLHCEGHEVEMVLADTGEIVVGWLFCGSPLAARTFWRQGGRRGTEMIEPIGWREIRPGSKSAMEAA